MSKEGNGQSFSDTFHCQQITVKLVGWLTGGIGADLHEIQLEAPCIDADMDWMDKKSRSSAERGWWELRGRGNEHHQSATSQVESEQSEGRLYLHCGQQRI